MEAILQGLMELSGVRATMVLDDVGQVVAHRGQAVYDREVCAQVGATVTKAIESIQLQQQDWETITAQYADGRIVLRKVAARAGLPRHVLAVIADASLNASFATVALRVAANKVRGAIEGGGSQPALGSSQAAAAGSQPGISPAPVGAPPPSASPGDSRPNLANTGTSWSRAPGAGSSASAVSGVTTADPASAAFLARCAKELARSVGPIAKVYVQEAVRRISPDAPFAMALARQLVGDLAGQIEDPEDRAGFRKAGLEKE